MISRWRKIVRQLAWVVVIVVVTEIEKEMLGMCMRLCTYVDEQQKGQEKQDNTFFLLAGPHLEYYKHNKRNHVLELQHILYKSERGERDGVGWRRR